VLQLFFLSALDFLTASFAGCLDPGLDRWSDRYHWSKGSHESVTHTGRATTELAEAGRLAGEGSFSSVVKMKAGAPPAEPNFVRNLFLVGLRKAETPEE
jgi:hypothetical protein